MENGVVWNTSNPHTYGVFYYNFVLMYTNHQENN